VKNRGAATAGKRWAGRSAIKGPKLFGSGFDDARTGLGRGDPVFYRLLSVGAPLAMKATWDSVRAKGKLRPQTAPVPMLDVLTTLLTTPPEVRAIQFARVVSHLKYHA